MFGVNASYPFTRKLTATAFVLNGYWHLAHANNVPSSGGQLAYAATEHVNVKETILYGPHQSNTALEFWRFFSDSIAEWKRDRLTTAFEYQIGTERVDVTGNPRALWMSAQLPVQKSWGVPWRVTLRPWMSGDRAGRWVEISDALNGVGRTV